LNPRKVWPGEFICSGWFWGANVGWINIGNGFPVNNIQYQNNSATDYGVNYGFDPAQPGYAILRGYAYGANIGWINFEATGNPRIRFTDGALEGYAYSANCVWIYTIETNPDLSPLSWVNDTTFSYPIAPDAGTSTTRTLIASTAAKRFYRIKSVRPLP
jgi:hypothetical protein